MHGGRNRESDCINQKEISLRGRDLDKHNLSPDVDFLRYLFVVFVVFPTFAKNLIPINMKIVSNKFYLLVIMLLVQIACIKSHAQEEPQKTIQVSKISQQRSSTGQTGSDIYEEKLLHNILPVAPTAASLGMYGTYPVALSNGTLPLDIVLYEIKSGDLSVPITLKYHSGGIKVSQEASWVGLGWNLDFGGAIVRTVNGFPDEDENSAVPDEMSVINEMEKHMNDGQDFDKYSLWSKANDRQYSFRPDNFYYSIGKYSGEFFLKNDTLIPTEFIPITGTLSKLRSLVVTPEGNEYVFNASETTGLTSSHIKQPKYVSTYYIKSIVSPNRTDTIRYTYQQSGVYSTTTSYSFEGFSKISRNVLAYGIEPQDEDPLPLYEMKPIAISGDVYIARVETVKPRYIYFRGGRITFNLSDREDLYPESQSNKAKKLDNIVIEKEEKGRYYAIRKIYFIYSYFSGNGDAASRRLCLDAVTECGLAGEESVNKPIASFEYYGKDSLPNKYSNSIDYWGYYNGKSNDGSIPKTDFSSYKAAFGIMGNADRTSDEKYMQYGSNGAMTRDPNKGMSIEYADNGTPRTIRFDNGNSISYIYGADGEKLKTEWTSRGDAFRPKAGTTTGGVASAVPAATNSEETFGPFVYIDGRLAEVRFDDGYCTIDSSGRADYHYYVRDYMGSVCVVTDDDGNIEQQNAYYAWGGIYSAMSVNPSLQDRKYSGKPFDRRHGLDFYDYGARRYDPALARWTSPDPLCESYYNVSPYAFCHNNPVCRIDIDGLADYFDSNGYFMKSDNDIKNPYIYIAHGNQITKLSDYNFGKNRRAMMRVVFHYADATGTSKVARIIGVSRYAPDGDSHTMAYNNYSNFNRAVRVVINKDKNGNLKFKEELSQIYNMMNTLEHEKFHISHKGDPHPNTAAYYKEEVEVLMQQMSSPNFKKATNSYQRGVAGYLQGSLVKLYESLPGGKSSKDFFKKVMERASIPLERAGVNYAPRETFNAPFMTFDY
jgi:RHS repeat-associated protein